MDSDERFKHLASDPRFRTLRRKQRKVQIDDRFKSMFTDERFTLEYKQDKRGRNQKKTSGDDLKRYYHLDERNKDDKQDDVRGEEDEDEVEEGDEHKDIVQGSDEEDVDEDNEDENEDEDENDNENDSEAYSSSEGEVSSSSDESDSDEPESEVDEDDKKIQYDWKPLDHDAERAEIVTRRIAIQNLDWNHLDVKDIYTLVNSIRPPLNVKIYVSEFGKERLAKEEIEGPLELADMPQLDEEEEEYQQLEEKMQALENKGQKKYKVNEYEDADEILDSKNEEIRERLRRYQLSQMKYYYAIAEFDSPESAQAVYKELDGVEYEGSSLELDLRYVPDEMDFDPADVKAVCDKVPDLAIYKAPQFINSALQQTTVKFTWDETDVKRQEKLHKAYTKQELEKDDLAAYLASETDSDDEAEDAEADGDDKSETMTVMTGNSEARANKYRQLLKSLDEEQERKKKTDVDIEWGSYESASESEKEDTREREREEKKSKTKQRAGKKSKRKNDEDAVPDPNLDLLVMDGSKQDDFKFDPDDDRFKAVYDSGLYNIDPSHPNFKRTEALSQIAERKREKRRKTTR